MYVHTHKKMPQKSEKNIFKKKQLGKIIMLIIIISNKAISEKYSKILMSFFFISLLLLDLHISVFNTAKKDFQKPSKFAVNLGIYW